MLEPSWMRQLDKAIGGDLAWEAWLGLEVHAHFFLSFHIYLQPYAMTFHIYNDKPANPWNVTSFPSFMCFKRLFFVSLARVVPGYSTYVCVYVFAFYIDHLHHY